MEKSKYRYGEEVTIYLHHHSKKMIKDIHAIMQNTKV
jgi:hypothetical protein